MAKRQRSVGLSYLLLRFVIVMLGCMLLCLLVWYVGLVWLQNAGIVYRPGISNQQVEQILADKPEIFVAPGDDFLAEYALFGQDGTVLQSNVEGKKLEALAAFLPEGVSNLNVSRHAYADGSTGIFRWRWRAEFADPGLRRSLPSFEYLWLGALALGVVLCLAINTSLLRRKLVSKLQIFKDVSQRVARQALDFETPSTQIKEFDDAMGAMDEMRVALKDALAEQWAAEQARQAEISALAHDLKTPLTIIGGNAELLLEERVSPEQRRMLESIEASAGRAKHFVLTMLETAAGEEEAFGPVSLPALLDDAVSRATASAKADGVRLIKDNALQGSISAQPERLSRALDNIIQNAIEHTPRGQAVWVAGECNGDAGWCIQVEDSGDGFSKAAMQNATKRFWRGDRARTEDGHNGLGLWFADEVVKAHGGTLQLSGGEQGGRVNLRF